MPDPGRFIAHSILTLCLIAAGILGIKAMEQKPVATQNAVISDSALQKISPDSDEYMDIILLARVPASGTMGDIDDAVDAIPTSSELHSVRFISFAPDSTEDYLVVKFCGVERGKPAYCTGK